MELFDTHFVEFGQVLAVSGQKTLAIPTGNVLQGLAKILIKNHARFLHDF